MKGDIHTVLEIVKDVLGRDKRARVNDTWLLTRGWKHKDVKGVSVEDHPDGSVTIHLQPWAIEDAPKPESFRRVRAKLQSEGQYLPKEDVVERKKELAEEMRSTMGREWPG